MAKLDKLITYAYLREENDIPQNLPDAEFEKLIYEGQETLRMLMGDEFYQSYLATYKAGPLTGVDLALYDPYIKQYIARQAYQYWTVHANFKPTRAGFRVHTEENSVVATDIQMATIIKDAKEKAQYYKELLLGFLNSHYADYPLYQQSCRSNLAGNGFHISAVSNKHKNVSRGGCWKC